MVKELKHYEFINILPLSDERSYEKLLGPRSEDSPRTQISFNLQMINKSILCETINHISSPSTSPFILYHSIFKSIFETKWKYDIILFTLNSNNQQNETMKMKPQLSFGTRHITLKSQNTINTG